MMNKIRAVVIDDEPKSREVLTELIQLFCPDLEVVGSAGSISEAVELINAIQPQLVFFDILLQEGDSFEIIKRLEEVNFDMIFVTAFDEDSVKALKFSGARVLLKPIQVQDLVDAVAEVKRQKGSSYQSYKMAKGMLKSNLSKLPVITSAGLEFYPVKEVLYVQREDSGCTVLFKDGKSIRTERMLEEFQDLLDTEQFRFLKALIVNRSEIQELDEAKGRLKFKGSKWMSY